MNLARCTCNAPHGRYVDNSAMLFVNHIGKRKLTAIENAPYVAVKHSVIVLVCDIRKKLDLCNTCIIYEHINRAEFFFCFGKKALGLASF